MYVEILISSIVGCFHQRRLNQALARRTLLVRTARRAIESAQEQRQRLPTGWSGKVGVAQSP